MKPVLSATHIGRLAALGSASSFAIVSTLAGLAYAGGASPAAVITTRLAFGMFGGIGAILMLRRAWTVPRREWWPTLAIAGAWLIVNVGYMGSFYYIPVSLSVLIFFTFPVQIALIGPLVQRRRPELITVAAALIAFSGLALSLGPDMAGLDWRGCALAFMAAVGIMFTFLASRRLVVEQDMFTFSFNLHALCVGAAIVYAFSAGGIAVPASALAIGALAGVGAFYAAAVLMQFVAIRLAGPARASIVFNAEPVVTVIGAALLLGERLGPGQIVGAALVIGAVLLSTRADV